MDMYTLIKKVNAALGHTEDDFQINFDPNDKTPKHGILGAFGVADKEWQQYAASFKQFEQGEITGSQLGQAVQQWYQSEQEKPLLQWLLGL